MTNSYLQDTLFFHILSVQEVLMPLGGRLWESWENEGCEQQATQNMLSSRVTCEHLTLLRRGFSLGKGIYLTCSYSNLVIWVIKSSRCNSASKNPNKF